MSSLFVSNILDPVHPGLDSTVWDNPESPVPKLKPGHRKWITHAIVSTLENAGYTHVTDWLSLVLTGSLTTYQYSPESDCDVSLWVEAEVFPGWSRGEMIGIMISQVDGTKLPGTTHPMQDFVVASTKFTKHDLYQPGLRSGYDLMADDWIVPPDKSRIHDVQHEMAQEYVIALESVDKMEHLLRYEPDKAILFWHQLHKKRMRDQMAGKGDFAQSNIIYKLLENRGLFPQISDVSGEYIAKFTAHRNVAKFVYDTKNNRLLIGHMAPEEGAVESHYDLLRQSDIDPNDVALGQIGDDGYVEIFGRAPRIGLPSERTINPYEAQYRTQEAVRRAVPGVRFMSEQDQLRPEWKLQSNPEVDYLGEPPQIANENSSPKTEWGFETEAPISKTRKGSSTTRTQGTAGTSKRQVEPGEPGTSQGESSALAA